MITANFKNDFCNDSICSLGYIKAKVKKKRKIATTKYLLLRMNRFFFLCILIGNVNLKSLCVSITC